MDPQTALFQQHRPRLFGLAYRMLGTPGDAEDALHDAWLRWHAQDTTALDDPEAWLVTVTTRIALDRLRRLQREREHYIGPWMPEPLIADTDQPEAQLERSETLTMSFLLLLERLSAEERAAFLLQEIFDYSHAETAAMLGISEDACRQRVHRAKARLREGRARFELDAANQQRLLQRFVEAMEQPNLATLRALFAEDAVHLADGGGVALATLRPLHGADRLAQLYLQIALRQRVDAAWRYELHTINGEPTLLIWDGERLATACWVQTDGEHIVTISHLRHPTKLARLEAVTKARPATSLH